MICTRVNKINKGKFHYKNELLLSTGKLKVELDAEKHDTHSFLKKEGEVAPKKEEEIRKKEELDDSTTKKQREFEEAIIEMEDNNSKQVSEKKMNKTSEKNNQRRHRHRKGKNKEEDSSSDDTSNRKESKKPRQQEREGEGEGHQDYYCFLVVNGRKGKFFYAKSRSEMEIWTDKLEVILEGQREKERKENGNDFFTNQKKN